MSASWEVQETLVEVLENDSELLELVSGIYDTPPANYEEPYIAVGDDLELPDNTLSNEGYIVYATFHIHTKPGRLGFRPAKKIKERMNELLNHARLTMGDNYAMVMCYFDNAITERDKDKRIISVRYRVVTHKK